MKRKIQITLLLACIAIILTPTFAHAQKPFLDGNVWNDLEGMHKLMYTEGYSDGRDAMKFTICAKTQACSFGDDMHKALSMGGTYMEIMGAVDSFYKTQENLHILVWQVLVSYVPRKLEKASPEELKNLEIELRKSATEYRESLKQ